MKPKWILELEDLCAKATPGPWHKLGSNVRYTPAPVRGFVGEICGLTSHDAKEQDLEFIAAARSALPKLLAVNAKMVEALRKAKENFGIAPLSSMEDDRLRAIDYEMEEALAMYESGVVEQRETGDGEHE